MLKKIIYYTIIIIVPFVTLTGCFDAKSIESYEYCVAIGIDKSTTEGNITFSMQIMKPNSSSSGGSNSQSKESSSNSKIISVECTSINNGISIINSYSNKEINLSHCTAVIFSEEIANEGIEKFVTALSNNSEIRPTCMLIISNEKALTFLDTSSKSSEQFSSDQYEYINLSSKTTGYTDGITMYEYLTSTQESSPDGIIPYVEVYGDTAQPYGICVMKNHKLVGKLSPQESICHLIVTNQLEESVVEIPSPFTGEENINIKLNLKKDTECKISINNSAPYIDIKCYLEGEILNDSSYFDSTSTETINTISSSLNSYLESILSEYLYKISQEYEADVADLARFIKINYKTTSDWNNVNWNNIYKNSFFNVSISCNLQPGYIFLKE